jgi:hypothetical protein
VEGEGGAYLYGVTQVGGGDGGGGVLLHGGIAMLSVYCVAVGIEPLIH